MGLACIQEIYLLEEEAGKARRSFRQQYKSNGFPGGSDADESAGTVGDPGSIPGSGRSTGEGNGHPLQYFGLENPMDRGA